MKILTYVVAFIVLATTCISCKKEKPEPPVEEVFVRLNLRANENPTSNGFVLEQGRVELAIILNGVNGKQPEIVFQRNITFGEPITFTLPKYENGWYTVVATNTTFFVGNSTANSILSTKIEPLYKNMPISTKTPYFITRKTFKTHNDIPLGYNYWNMELESPYLYKSGEVYSREK